MDMDRQNNPEAREEQKKSPGLKKSDLIVICGILAAAVLLLVYGRGRLFPSPAPTAVPAETAAAVSAESEESTAETASPEGVENAETTAETAAAESEESALMKEAEASVNDYMEKYPAESYLLLTTSSGVYSPLPLNEDNAFRITQPGGEENVIHIGKNSFYMESSNCDNQNCVDQGEVTLENRETRILFNMVICLPHNLSLELLTPDEARSVLLEMALQEAMMAGTGEADDAA